MGCQSLPKLKLLHVMRHTICEPAVTVSFQVESVEGNVLVSDRRLFVCVPEKEEVNKASPTSSNVSHMINNVS